MTDEEIDWNTCVPFTGPEAALPAGIYLPPGLIYEDFIVDGSVKKGKSGQVIDLQVDNEAYEQYGKGILITTALGDRVSRETWYNSEGPTYHTDGLKLQIIKHLNREITGGGVHTGG